MTGHVGGERSVPTIAYVAATVLGGVGALVMVVMSLQGPEPRTLDVLLWCALAVLLFASAAYRWWRGGHREARARRIAGRSGPRP